jgi:hypothetical protein
MSPSFFSLARERFTVARPHRLQPGASAAEGFLGRGEDGQAVLVARGKIGSFELFTGRKNSKKDGPAVRGVEDGSVLGCAGFGEVGEEGLRVRGDELLELVA